MKTHALALILGLTATTMGYTAEPATTAAPGSSPSPSSCTPDTIVFNFPSQDLSQAEKDGILLLLGQEKLLRDMYTKLYEKWQLPEFQNIPSGEDRHAKGVKALLKKYQLTDPNADKAVGVFAEAKLTQQYQDLVTKGSVSLIEALTVLASLEEQDAVALEKAITGTDNFDVQFVYKQLAKGSRNHLRDLVNLLQGKGVTYKPVSYSAADFQKVLDSSKEKYLYDDPAVVPCKPKIQEKLQMEGKPNLRSPQPPPVIRKDYPAAPEGEGHEGADRD
jgi:hypothetical protein